MTYTEERLEVFNKKFVKDCGPGIEDVFIDAVGSVGPIRRFLAESIQEARAEERGRIEEMRNAPPPYPADEENPMKHVYQNEGYAEALDEILTP